MKHLGIYLRSYHGESTEITDPGEILGLAGVQAHDLVLSVNGTNVTGAVEGCQLLAAVEPGKVIELVLHRKKDLDSKDQSKESDKQRKPIGHAKPFNSEMAISTGSGEMGLDAPAEEQPNFFKGIGEWVGMVSKRILQEEPTQQEAAKSGST